MIARASRRSACGRPAQHVRVVVAARHLGLLGVARVHRAHARTLLATMLTPVPEPHASTARSAPPSETRPAASRRGRGSRPTPRSRSRSRPPRDRPPRERPRSCASAGSPHGRIRRRFAWLLTIGNGAAVEPRPAAAAAPPSRGARRMAAPHRERERDAEEDDEASDQEGPAVGIAPLLATISCDAERVGDGRAAMRSRPLGARRRSCR